MKLNSKLPLLSLAFVVITLAGCGGSSTRNYDVKTPDPVIVDPVKMIDAFTKFVLGLVATAPDDNEPIAITDVAVTIPEDIEPVAVN
jgi:hypothetical protein